MSLLHCSCREAYQQHFPQLLLRIIFALLQLPFLLSGSCKQFCSCYPGPSVIVGTETKHQLKHFADSSVSHAVLIWPLSAYHLWYSFLPHDQKVISSRYLTFQCMWETRDGAQNCKKTDDNLAFKKIWNRFSV